MSEDRRSCCTLLALKLRLRVLDAWSRNSPSSLIIGVVDEFPFCDTIGEIRWFEDFCPIRARSLREALPRFFRSLIYSQPKPSSIYHQQNSHNS